MLRSSDATRNSDRIFVIHFNFFKMKTKFYHVITVLLTVFLFSPAKGEVTEIVVCRSDSNAQVIHRAPAQSPIMCFLEDDTNLVVTLLDNLGTISMEIENQTTGEYDQTYVNALVGPMVFVISGTSGLWSITFILTDGTVYSGEFNL